MAKEDLEIPKFRSSHLFKMAAKIAVKQGQKYLNSKPESKLTKFIDQAHILVDHVGRLKGAAMKAVQTLSIEGQDLLPPEVLQVLETLQSQSQPLDNTVLIEQIEQELGNERFKQLENLKPQPIAAASIGQVYRAKYKGQDVVVKVQYPGVAESVDSDINTLKKLLKALLVVSQKKIDMDEMMEEVRKVLKLETDYQYEAAALAEYKELFKGSEYRIPQVFPEMTTKKVLVMTREDGLEFTDWLREGPSEEEKQKVADQLLNLYVKEFFENQLVQTDPNPANFLINSSGQIVLLDFGATLHFEKDFVRDYQRLVRVCFSRQKDLILKQVLDMEFIKPEEPKETKDLFVDFMLFSMTPFEEKRQPFDFSNSEYSREVREKALEFSRMLKYSPPPKKIIFLHRKLGGIFMLLKKMQVRADLNNFRETMLNKDFGL